MRPFLPALAVALASCTASGGSAGPPVPPFDGKVPPATCEAPVQPRNTSSPTEVVGTGTAASCTEAALRDAAGRVNGLGGGTITFSCGDAPATITVASQIVFTGETTLDGGGRVTLSGGNSTRILYLDSGYDRTTPRLWVQGLTFVSGKSARVAGDDTASGGAAIYRDGGSLTVVNCAFLGNHAPSSGQDLAGGAIYAFGGGDTVIVGSTFIGNSASDGGAVGSLNGDLAVVNSTFTDNQALGTGGNPGDGGCGGAVYQDGADEVTTLCGVTLRNNGAGAIGGGMFRVSNYDNGTMTMDLSTVDANQVTAAGDGNAGGMYLQGLDLTITRSTVSRNSAFYDGGLWISEGTLDLADSTIAGNTATGSNGGGLWLSYDPPGRILNVTIAGNHAPGGSGGAIFRAGSGGGGPPVLQNTILAANDARWNDHCEAGGRLGDGGGNLESSAAGSRCAAGATASDPLLSALGDNGGPTETMLPAAISPARRLATAGCPTVDQRNQPRGTPCTAGAVEVP